MVRTLAGRVTDRTDLPADRDVPGGRGLPTDRDLPTDGTAGVSDRTAASSHHPDAAPATGIAPDRQRQLLKRHFTARTLPQLRYGVEECVAKAGLSEPRRGEFVLAIDAVSSNAVEYAGGAGQLLLRDLGGELEATITDEGPGFSADVIPKVLPGLDGAPLGRGLWLATITTDRLTIERGQVGAIVTLGVKLPASHPR